MTQTHLEPVVDALRGAVFDESAVQRLIDPASQLQREIDTSVGIQRHFLSELPNHAVMSMVALSDGCEGLAKLGSRLPFSSVAVARSVLEAAGDLHWLVCADQSSTERARRAMTIYLLQTETTIRQLEQLQERRPDLDVGAGIDEGWELLRATAKEAELAGYEVKESKRPGRKYTLAEGKPATSKLVDSVVTKFYGQTGVRLYSSYSATAHAEGGGLGALLDVSDTVSTEAGQRSAYGIPVSEWMQRVVDPVRAVTVGVAREALKLMFPSQEGGFNERLS